MWDGGVGGAGVGGVLEVEESDEDAEVLAVAGLPLTLTLLLLGGSGVSARGAAGGLAAAGCPGWRMEWKVRRAPLKKPLPLPPPPVSAALFPVS